MIVTINGRTYERAVVRFVVEVHQRPAVLRAWAARRAGLSKPTMSRRWRLRGER